MCIRLFFSSIFFFFQAEDGIRDLVRSRGLGDVYKRQVLFIDTSTAQPNEFDHSQVSPPSDVLKNPALVEILSLIHI